MADEITLNVNGVRFSGWKSGAITRDLDALSGGFSLGVTDLTESMPVREGDRCEVLINGSPVVTGFVDSREISVRPGGFDVQIAGRDASGDLVDSSAELPPWEFTDRPAADLIRKLCANHGVTVSLQPGLVLPNVAKFSVNPGESCGSAIETLCRKLGVLATSDGLGGVLITRAGTERSGTRLVLGVNVLEATLRLSQAQRFGRYKVLGSHKKSENQGSHSVKAEALDGAARASRLLIVRPEGNVTGDMAKRRAEWEASVRASKGDTLTVTVSGWTHNRARNAILGGVAPPWKPNLLVDVELGELNFSATMLVTGVRQSLSVTEGARTVLELSRPDAFTPDPALNQKAGGSNYWPELVRGV